MNASLPRRVFLASGASLAGAGWAGLLPTRAAAAPALARPTLARLEKLALRRSAFLPLLGQTFRIGHGRGSVTVVLRQVIDLEPAVMPGSEHQFSLIFSGPAHRRGLPQGTYRVSHPSRDRISLFVVPVGHLGTTQHYQAIIDSLPRPRHLTRSA